MFCLVFLFSGFTFLLYYQVSLFFLNSQFFTYILYIFRFSISFIFSGFNIFSISSRFFFVSFVLCFLYVLHFEFPQPLPMDFMSRKCFIYRFVLSSWPMSVMLKDWWFCGKDPPEWMNILRINLFETAIHFVHSNDH